MNEPISIEWVWRRIPSARTSEPDDRWVRVRITTYANGRQVLLWPCGT